jgi:hypothetical protein
MEVLKTQPFTVQLSPFPEIYCPIAIWDFGFRIQNQRPKTKNQKPKTQNRKPLTNDSADQLFCKRKMVFDQEIGSWMGNL